MPRFQRPAPGVLPDHFLWKEQLRRPGLGGNSDSSSLAEFPLISLSIRECLLLFHKPSSQTKADMVYSFQVRLSKLNRLHPLKTTLTQWREEIQMVLCVDDYLAFAKASKSSITEPLTETSDSRRYTILSTSFSAICPE